MKKIVSLVSRLVKEERGDIIQKLVIAGMVLTAGVSTVHFIGEATENKGTDLGGLVGQIGHK